MVALQQPTIRVAAVIAEGVPEADTKKLIAFARAHNKVLIGPATVGGIQVHPNQHLAKALNLNEELFGSALFCLVLPLSEVLLQPGLRPHDAGVWLSCKQV